MRARRTPYPVGTTGLALSLLALAMAAFAMLDLMRARSALRLSEAYRDSVEARYQAYAQANAMVAALSSGDIPPGAAVDGDTISWSVPAGGSQRLLVSVDDGHISEWRTEPDGAWDPGTGPGLWDGVDVP